MTVDNPSPPKSEPKLSELALGVESSLRMLRDTASRFANHVQDHLLEFQRSQGYEASQHSRGYNELSRLRHELVELQGDVEGAHFAARSLRAHFMLLEREEQLPLSHVTTPADAVGYPDDRGGRS
jgi:hypothetical protein